MFTVLGFSSGRRVVATVLGLSLVQLVDTSDPFRWRVIQVSTLLGRCLTAVFIDCSQVQAAEQAGGQAGGRVRAGACCCTQHIKKRHSCSVRDRQGAAAALAMRC